MNESSRPRVIVAHPGRQHSHRAAYALERAELLAGYWSGVPLGGLFSNDDRVSIPRSKLSGAPWAPGLRRLLEAVLPGRSRTWADFFANRLFDRWAARKLQSCRAEAVIGYEVGCANLFRQAKEQGIYAILDAASVHYRAQDRVRAFHESARLHRTIIEVKERELSLADYVIVASSVSLSTFIEGGVPRERIRIVPLGADLSLFTPAATSPGPTARFLFVGKISSTKGLDLLLEAFARVRKAASVRLRLVGPRRHPGSSIPSSIEVVRAKGAALAEEYRQADCLVVPSRFDGFAMVVAEALACGTPVIVSDRVGAKDLVEEGCNGWIVAAGDVDALTNRMLWCAKNLDQVRATRSACVHSVGKVSWEQYYVRFAAMMKNLLNASGCDILG